MGTTLADHLRSLPDDGLRVLIELRPDLVVPVPADLSALAVRVQSRLSVARALDGLDQFTLEVLDALRLTRTADGTTSVDAVLALTTTAAAGPEPQEVCAAIDTLRAHVLVYGTGTELHVVATVDDVCSPYPAGLGRPAAQLDEQAAELVADPAGLRRTLLAAPPVARAVLHRLAAGPPIGSLANGTLNQPVQWLVQRRLLVPVSDTTVELPREVGLLLRRDAGALGTLHPRPPAVEPALRDPKAVDSAGAGQAMEAVRHTEALLEALGTDPAPMLRSGGLGVRELRRLARTAGVDDSMAALLLEVAHAAGLVGTWQPGDRTAEAQFLPAGSYDGWRARSIPRQWAVLARAWLGMSRDPRLVGERDERDRPISALAPEAERVGAPGTRHEVLRVLAGLPPGAAPDPEDVLARLAWRTPRWAHGREPGTRSVLADAALLGVSGLGALTTYGRLLFSTPAEAADETGDPLGLHASDDDRGDPVVAALDELLPEPVDHVLLQADLSVVVPGPPEPTLATELALVADRESAGGASVYRVTPVSVRRAFDAGYASSDLHGLFARRSRTPVPQALTYLIEDVARRHGGLRVGTAGAYLRSDDEPLLAELLVDRRLSGLALRRLAPTVLATPYGSGRLLGALREAGYAPVPEDATGAAVLTRPKARRGQARVGGRSLDSLRTPRLTAPRMLGIVEQMRRGDAAARAARRAPVTVRAANGHAVDGLTAVQAHHQALAVLQQALRDRALVWVGYVDAHGSSAQRLVRPVSIGAGYLRAEDDRSDTLHTFALHRITAAALAD